MTIIFSDGFESGDFSAWTGIFESASCVATIVESPHCGVYSASFYNVGTGACDVRKIIAESETVYTRFYIAVDSLPTTNGKEVMFLQYSGTINTQLAVGIRNVAGELKIVSKEYADAEYTSVISSSLVNASYFVVEVAMNTSASGWVKIYVNDTLDYEHTGVDFSSRGNINVVRIGNGVYNYGTDYENTVLIDCVVVSDSYIGPESSGPRFYGDGLSWVVLR